MSQCLWRVARKSSAGTLATNTTTSNAPTTGSRVGPAIAAIAADACPDLDLRATVRAHLAGRLVLRVEVSGQRQGRSRQHDGRSDKSQKVSTTKKGKGRSQPPADA
jgi:hypothetical protein